MASTSLLRSDVSNNIIGTPKEFGLTQLPTVEDVLRQYVWEREEKMRILGSRKEPATKDLSSIVASKVVEIWDYASISGEAILSVRRIVAMILKYHDSVRDLQKSAKTGFQICAQRIADFQESAKKTLFDIAFCKCSDPVACNCEKQRKVPVLEVPFLLDQRTTRKMFIGNLDRQETKRRIKRLGRDLQRESSRAKKTDQEQSAQSFDPEEVEYVKKAEEDKASSSDEEYQPPKHLKTSPEPVQQMRLQLPAFCTAVYRTKTSTRHAALLASSLLEDVGMVTSENTENVIDASKIQRQKNVLATTILADTDAALKEKKLRALYFDGRQDRTLTLEKKKKSVSRVVKKEEHVVLVEEPGSEYLGHVTPESGSGDCIQKAMLNYCREKDIDLTNLSVIGGDGTPINSGLKNGAMSLCENSLNRALQRVICMFHTNELPLRHLFQSLDGKSTGPNTYAGPIGTLLQNCETLAIKRFDPIPVPWISDLQLEESSSLSSDQQYLLDICKAISSGDCPQGLADRSPGKLHQARWLTLANRTLRLYVSTSKPSDNLVRLVVYIMKVYAFIWFSIKIEPSIVEGPRHLWKLMSSSRCLDEVTKKIIDPVIKRNAWFSHPENLLLSMISDPDADKRQLGWRRILKARTTLRRTNAVREFSVPLEIRLDAPSYVEVIDWSNCKLTEPPLTKHISTEVLRENIRSSAFANEDLKDFPCHTQSVERMVKLVTEAASAVCGPEERHKFVFATLKSRKQMPKFDTKSSYKTST